MSGIFPQSADGGLPPNSANASNPTHAFPPTIDPAGTAALYYGNGCDVRLRPEVVNSLISEVAAVTDRAGLAYNPARLTNAELAIRYLIQRGLPHSGPMAGGPSNYTLTLDPVIMNYTNHLTLVVVPNVTNQTAITLNVNGYGNVPVLRNDGQPLEAGDISANRPLIISFWQGYFYVVGLVRSQVPIFLTGNLDLWVRTDGNDSTGDGTANLPNKAFRTIQHAFDVSGSRFAMSSKYSVVIRLGIPGTYEAGYFSGALTAMTLYGDPNNSANYKIAGKSWGSSFAPVVVSQQSLVISGVTLLIDMVGQSGTGLNCMGGAVVGLNNMRFEAVVDNASASMIANSGSSSIYTGGNIGFWGNTHNLNTAISMTKNATMWRSDPTAPVMMTFNNLNFSGVAFNIVDASNLDFDATTILNNATAGVKHNVTTNAVLQMRGQPEPGSVAGSSSTGGQFTA